MNFTINPEYLTSISIHREWNMYKDKPNPTEEDLIKVLQGLGDCSSQSTDDHPEFKVLRERLGQEQFIKIQRGWWNGDIVLRPFSLNGAKFRKGEMFPSGAAIGYTVESKLKKKNDK